MLLRLQKVLNLRRGTSLGWIGVGEVFLRSPDAVIEIRLAKLKYFRHV